MSEAQFDQSAWFERIGYSGPVAPTLKTLNRLIFAHAHAISLRDAGHYAWAPTQTRCGDASIQDDSWRARRILFRAEHALSGGPPLARLSDHQSPRSRDPGNGNRCAAPCYPHAVAGGTTGGALPSGRWLWQSRSDLRSLAKAPGRTGNAP